MSDKVVFLIMSVIVLIIFYGGRYLGQDIDHDDTQAALSSDSDLFLNEFDFSNGEYALYVNHKEKGMFMVLDKAALLKNKQAVKIDISWVNYLPGEGDRSLGLILFKDKIKIKQVTGGIFNVFEIGDLAESGLVVEQQRLSGVKQKIEQKIMDLQQRDKTFINDQPRFKKDDKAFMFNLSFPSMAVPVTRSLDQWGYERIASVNGVDNKEWQAGGSSQFERRWSDTLERCIRSKVEEKLNVDISVSANTLSDAYVFEVSEEWGSELRDAGDNMLYTKDYIYYDFNAGIEGSEDQLNKLLGLDYSDCLTEQDRNRPKVLEKMRQLVRQSIKPGLDVDNSEVGLSGYKDTVKQPTALYEQEYSLNWFEVEPEAKQ